MSGTWWIGFNLFVLAMLALDLGVFHRKAHVVSMKEALSWTATWIALALAVSAYVLWTFGRFEDTAASLQVMQAIVLGVPAALGRGISRASRSPTPRASSGSCA